MHHSLSDYLTDLIQNSIEAGSSVILVNVVENGTMITTSVSDNGIGMSSEILTKARNPFFTDGEKHKTRQVGLGLSFLGQMIQQCNGELDIHSEPGTGTSVYFSYEKTGPDAPPKGDLALMVVSCLATKGNFDLKFRHESNRKSYSVCRSELADAAGDLHDAGSLGIIRKYVRSLEIDIL